MRFRKYATFHYQYQTLKGDFMFKKMISDVLTAQSDSESTTQNETNTNISITKEKISKTISLQDGYAAKVYLLSQYPMFSPHKLITTTGATCINVGNASYTVTHSLEQTTVTTTGISTTIANQTLSITKTKDAKNIETAAAICTYVYLYTQYGGMF